MIVLFVREIVKEPSEKSDKSGRFSARKSILRFEESRSRVKD